jgi:transposase
MQDAPVAERIRQKYRALSPVMDERMRRQWAASEADVLGWGGVSLVSAATGLARNTIAAGLSELEYRRGHPREAVDRRIREAGGGRKSLAEIDPGLQRALEKLVDPVTRGHPESPLRGTCKSTARLAEELTRQNHPVSDRTVSALLKEAGYSLQANRKTREGSSHPDRNAQFEYIGQQVILCQRQRQPVVSVDDRQNQHQNRIEGASGIGQQPVRNRDEDHR